MLDSAALVLTEESSRFIQTLLCKLSLLELGLSEPAVMIDHELLHLAEEANRPAVDRLHLGEHVRYRLLQLRILLNYLSLQIGMHLGRSLCTTQLISH